MFSRRTSLATNSALLFAALLILPTPAAWARGGFKTLYAFTVDTPGSFPVGALVADSAGNLYGTTAFGGLNKGSCCGTVFELARNAEGRRQEQTLYEFQGSGDGDTPEGTLIFDKKGNLYEQPEVPMAPSSSSYITRTEAGPTMFCTLSAGSAMMGASPSQG